MMAATQIFLSNCLRCCLVVALFGFVPGCDQGTSEPIAASAPPPPPPTQKKSKKAKPRPPIEEEEPEESEKELSDKDAEETDEVTEEEPDDGLPKEPLEPDQAKEFFESLGARIVYDPSADHVRAFLNRSKVEDVHLRYLKYLPKLEVVNITGLTITDEGLKHLADVSSLKRLYPVDTSVSEDGMDELKQSLPELKVMK